MKKADQKKKNWGKLVFSKIEMRVYEFEIRVSLGVQRSCTLYLFCLFIFCFKSFAHSFFSCPSYFILFSSLRLLRLVIQYQRNGLKSFFFSLFPLFVVLLLQFYFSPSLLQINVTSVYIRHRWRKNSKWHMRNSNANLRIWPLGSLC